MAHVHSVFCDEAMSPVVHRLAELGRARLGLKESANKPKAKVGSKNRDWRRLRALARSDHSLLAVVGSVNPIIDAEPEIGNPAFRVYHGKAREQYPPLIRLSVSVCVFEIENIRGGADDQPAFPGKHAGYLQKLVGENSGAIDAAVVVRILQQADLPPRRLPRRRIVGKIEHFRAEG